MRLDLTDQQVDQVINALVTNYHAIGQTIVWIQKQAEEAKAKPETEEEATLKAVE